MIVSGGGLILGSQSRSSVETTLLLRTHSRSSVISRCSREGYGVVRKSSILCHSLVHERHACEYTERLYGREQ
jgi:hypothetical protein